MGLCIVRKKQLGLPQSSREIFALLQEKGFIDKELSTNLQAMVGFRNIAIHSYQKMSIEILQNILENKLSDIAKFAQIGIELAKPE